MRYVLTIFLCTLLVVAAGCDPREHPDVRREQKDELLVYSGMTMIKPLLELAKIIERENDCVVRVTYGGTGHIAKSVRVNQIGDIFFPGENSYVQTLQDEGLVTDVVTVGINQAALFVQRGNPLHITASLQELTDPGYHVVLGNELSGAIGRETKIMLADAGLYDAVIENVLYMATDSKGLAQAIRHQDADLVINWKAVAFLPENKYVMEALELPETIAKKHPLQMALLSYSRHEELARAFLSWRALSEARRFFAIMGLLTDHEALF